MLRGTFGQQVPDPTDTAAMEAFFTVWLEQGEDLKTHDALFLLADEWAAIAPQEAVGYLGRLEVGGSRNPYLFSALSQWAGQDPEAALAWLNSNRDDREQGREYLTAALIRGAATADPDFALKLLLEAPDSPEKLGSVEFLTRVWLQGGLDAAVAGLDRLPMNEAGIRERAIQQIARRADDRSAVAAWAVGLPDSRERMMAVSAVAARWSQQDPAEAAAWVDGLASAPIRSDAYGEIGTRWARRDPLAAADWLSEQDGSAEHDLAARGVAWSTVGVVPDKAFEQVASITHAGLREETFEQLGRMWISQQPQRAKSYLEGENLMPRKIRDRLLEVFE
ncbi:hypothetical protein [Haloferula rosea]|uniref:Uncharacterized protein n=1 Tax=Haloferula rosea TaxID=490093 RepID=A0A934VG15_9BACT|nr:hypothetical protein [Haloferula rosea]MBK1828934.1 hypothetical protein [Haloferula rosea]